jgi:hypothetical protein
VVSSILRQIDHLVHATQVWCAFGIGAVLGLTIMLVRRHVPESPRRLFIHGWEAEAERIVDSIEHDVAAGTGEPLAPVDEAITVRQRRTIGFRAIARTAIKVYPKRTVLGLALFVGQAFLYNGVTFDLGTLLHTYYRLASGAVPLFIVIYAIGNFFGPVTLGRLSTPSGRKPMISLSYLGSAAVLGLTGVFVACAVLALALVLPAWLGASRPATYGECPCWPGTPSYCFSCGGAGGGPGDQVSGPSASATASWATLDHGCPSREAAQPLALARWRRREAVDYFRRSSGVAEGRQVAGVAGGDDVAVDDDLTVDPLGTRVTQVGAQRRPRRHRVAVGDTGLGEHPGRVADRGGRLAGVVGLSDERDHALVWCGSCPVSSRRDDDRVDSPASTSSIERSVVVVAPCRAVSSLSRSRPTITAS